jgi:hypothetical protein
MRRVEKKLAGTGVLRPGEELRSCFWAYRHFNLGSYFALAIALGEGVAYFILAKPYFLATSDERLVLLTCSRLVRRPRKLVFVDELERVSLIERKKRLISDIIAIKRRGDKKIYRFRVPWTYRRELNVMQAGLRTYAKSDRELAGSYRKLS